MTDEENEQMLDLQCDNEELEAKVQTLTDKLETAEEELEQTEELMREALGNEDAEFVYSGRTQGERINYAESLFQDKEAMVAAWIDRTSLVEILDVALPPEVVEVWQKLRETGYNDSDHYTKTLIAAYNIVEGRAL